MCVPHPRDTMLVFFIQDTIKFQAPAVVVAVPVPGGDA
jgi:hypothetical protein